MARRSASVVLLRGERAFEVLMVKRSAKSSFMPSALVFPGGVREPEDSAWAADLADGRPQLTDRVTAVRELFEETGLLLAHGAGALDPALRAQWRAEVHGDAARFRPLMTAAGLAPRADLLHGLCHFVTPEFERKRFSTPFFVARLDDAADATVSADEAETESAVWVSPAAALAQLATGAISLPPPQWYVLSGLAEHASAAAVVAHAAALPQPPPAMQPELLPGDGSVAGLADGEMCLALPGDARHSSAEPGGGGGGGGLHRIFWKGGKHFEYRLEVSPRELYRVGGPLGGLGGSRL